MLRSIVLTIRCGQFFKASSDHTISKVAVIDSWNLVIDCHSFHGQFTPLTLFVFEFLVGLGKAKETPWYVLGRNGTFLFFFRSIYIHSWLHFLGRVDFKKFHQNLYSFHFSVGHEEQHPPSLTLVTRIQMQQLAFQINGDCKSRQLLNCRFWLHLFPTSLAWVN